MTNIVKRGTIERAGVLARLSLTVQLLADCSYCSFDMVIAFPGGTGTDDCVKVSRKAGFEVRRVPENV